MQYHLLSNIKNKQKDKNQFPEELVFIVRPTSFIWTNVYETIKINPNKFNLHDTIWQSQISKSFLLTHMNRDSKTKKYRSPYTYLLYPLEKDQDQNFLLSPYEKDFKQKGNILFDEYVKLYYGWNDCIANLFVNQIQNGLDLFFIVQKKYNQPQTDKFQIMINSVWQSANQMQIRKIKADTVSYRLNSHIIYDINIKTDKNQINTIHGILQKNSTRKQIIKISEDQDQIHLKNTGEMIQDAQTDLKLQFQMVFMMKIKEIIFRTRIQETKPIQEQKKKFMKNIMSQRSQNLHIVECFEVELK